MGNDTSFAERADQIMNDAVEKAGELIGEKPQVAEVILKQLLRCDPEHSGGLQLLGLCKYRMGDNAEAVEIIQTALELDPTSPDNWNNLGLAYSALGRHERAISSILKAIECKPSQHLYKNNLGLQYKAIGDYDSAVRCMTEAATEGTQPQLWCNLGGLYGEMKMLEDAQRCFEKALSIDPNYAAAYLDLSFVYQLRGDPVKGFAAYEWRFSYYPQMQYYMKAYDLSKVWDGEADLNGKRVQLYGEQGLGDIIQFVRYAKELKARGAHVIAHVPPSLEAVVARVEGVDETTTRDIVEGHGEEFKPYDYHFAMMSSPYLLKADRPSGKPYMSAATDAFRGHIRAEYGNSFNVGIIWAGSPSHPNDRTRSIPLKEFAPLCDVEGVKLFSLQKDIRKRKYGSTSRLANLTEDPMANRFRGEDGVVDYAEGCEGMRVVDLTHMIQTMDDTATIITGLDLVVCCDTAVAHLAGAMGVPVWVAVPYNPDWRWGMDGERTHWYDSMRLFRQTERGDWAGVFKKITEELRATVLQNQR